MGFIRNDNVFRIACIKISVPFQPIQFTKRALQCYRYRIWKLEIPPIQKLPIAICFWAILRRKRLLAVM